MSTNYMTLGIYCVIYLEVALISYRTLNSSLQLDGRTGCNGGYMKWDTIVPFLNWRTRVRGKEERRTEDGWYPGQKWRFFFLDSPVKRYIKKALDKGPWYWKNHLPVAVLILVHTYWAIVYSSPPSLPMLWSIFKIGGFGVNQVVEIWKVYIRHIAQGVWLG